MSAYKREPRWSVELRRIYAAQDFNDTQALNSEFVLVPKVGFWATVWMWLTNETDQ